MATSGTRYGWVLIMAFVLIRLGLSWGGRCTLESVAASTSQDTSATTQSQATSNALPAFAEVAADLSIQPDQLRDLIALTLADIDMHSAAAVELLMLTSAQESHCGRYLQQVNGPALGIFQMEPATLIDLHNNFLKHKPELASKLRKVTPNTQDPRIRRAHLQGNLLYQIITARLQYYRFPARLPAANDVVGLAKYYKQYWNTNAGRATVEEAIVNYHKYAK